MTKIGGKKKKRGARATTFTKREIIFKETDQEYGVVEKVLGDMRVSVLCSDSTTKICRIRGKFKRRVWINVGDVVLVSLRDFDDEKGDVIHKYTADEAEFLKCHGEFNPDAYRNLTNREGRMDHLVTDLPPTDEEDAIDFDAI